MTLAGNWRRRLRLVFRIALVVILGLGIAAAVVSFRVEQTLARAESAARTTVPSCSTLELEDLVQEVSSDQNASRVLDAAANILLLAPFDAEEDARWRQVSADELGSASRGAAEAWLAEPHHALALAVLDAESDLVAARFLEPGSDAGLSIRQGDYSRLRLPILRLARLLRLRALLASTSGEESEAVGAVAAILRIASWQQQELPVIVAWMLRNAAVEVGLETLDELGPGVLHKAAHRELIATRLDDLAAVPVSHGLCGERAFGHRLNRHAGELFLFVDQPDPPATRLWNELSGQWFLQANAGAYLDAMTELIRLAEQPAHTRAPLTSLYGQIPERAIIARMQIPNLTDTIERTDEVVARQRLASFALQLAERSAADSATSSSVEERPLDPFTGSPFLEGREQGDCFLYSVGRNRNDDGGINARTPTAGDADDLRWHIPCVAPGLRTES